MASIKQFFFGNRYRTVVTIATFLLGLYALAGFVIVPWLARPRMVEAVADLTGRETRLDKLKLNPFTFSGTLSGFEITDTDGEPLLSFTRAHGNVQALSYVFGGVYHLKELNLADPYFRLEVNRSGTLNIADLVNQITELSKEDTKPEPDSEPKYLKVDILKIQEGSISVTDHSLSAPFSSIIAPINFDITGFHTSGESDAPYSFSATSESGESFSWEGFVALEPLRSKGAFEVKGFSMPKYEPFYDRVLHTDIVDGTIGVNGSYNYSSGQNGVMKLEDASVTIENVEVVKAADQTPVLSLAHGLISGVAMDYQTRALQIQSAAFKDGSLHAKRLRDGQIDLLTLVKDSVMQKTPADSEATPASDPAPQAPIPSYGIQSIELEGFSINLMDEAAPKPASFALDDARVSVGNIKSEPGAVVQLNLGATVRSGGSIKIDGSATLQPLSADLDLEIAEIALTPGNSYLTEFADVQLADGKISLTGRAVLNLGDEKPTGGFQGDLQLAEVKVVGGDLGQDLLQLTRLGMTDIQADLEPKAVEIGAIALVDPRATVLINEDGSINLLQALRISTGEPVEESDQPEAEESVDAELVEKPTGITLPFPVSIGSIFLENAGAVLTDRSISPPVNLGLETLSGTLSGLSSEELARADLDLTGTLVGGTQMAITGKINPLIEDRYSDIEMTFKDFNLTAVSPYSGKYAGYALQKGKLSFDLNYQVSQSELSGENVMVIDQLTLGEKVESEDALKLPIPLAISLMKDRDGVIEIDVPVSGNLNDPSFSFGRVISRAIVNVLTKLITSPFSMLGGLIPGGKEVDLSQVNFAPADAELDEDTQKTLKLLADALKERPNLTLDIVGAAGGAAEVNHLKLKQLNEKLRSLRWRELKEAGNNSITLDEVVLTQQERDQLIAYSFNQMFPEEAVIAETSKLVQTKSPTRPPAAPSGEPATTVAETETPKDPEDSKGIGAFFRRIFGGSTQSAVEEPETRPAVSPASAEPRAAAENSVTRPETEAALVAPPQLTTRQQESRLLETIQVSENDLHQLANTRAEAVRAHLQVSGEIAPERLFVVQPEDPALVAPDSGQPQVVFALE